MRASQFIDSGVECVDKTNETMVFNGIFFFDNTENMYFRSFLRPGQKFVIWTDLRIRMKREVFDELESS
jgi:hypothetical protein